MKGGWGHARPDEIALIEQLERDHLERPDIEQTLDLAQLYVDPMHAEDMAEVLLREVLQRDPGNARARFWLSMCLIRANLSDEAMREALALLAGVDDGQRSWQAAACLMMAEAEAWLSDPSDSARATALLERSVRLEPGWVLNRLILGDYYRNEGRTAEARTQYKAALANLQRPPIVAGLVDEYFHVNVTGLLEDSSRIEERLRAL